MTFIRKQIIKISYLLKSFRHAVKFFRDSLSYYSHEEQSDTLSLPIFPVEELPEEAFAPLWEDTPELEEEEDDDYDDDDDDAKRFAKDAADDLTKKLNELKSAAQKAKEAREQAEHEQQELVLQLTGYLPPFHLNKYIKILSNSSPLTAEKEWLENVSKLPFGKYIRKEPGSILEVLETLNATLYAMGGVKETVIRKIAACRKNNGRLKRPLLFVGPPGCGKTKMALTLPKLLGLEPYFISIPALNSGSGLSGTESHYNNSEVGEIVKGFLITGCMNPAFILDEVDKPAQDPRETSLHSVLLSICDPLLKSKFVDRSLGFPLDLSDALFIATCNDKEALPPALLDRMEIIEFPRYSKAEVYVIIKDYLFPALLQEYNLTEEVFCEPRTLQLFVESGYSSRKSIRCYEQLLEKAVEKAIYTLESTGLATLSLELKDFLQDSPCSSSMQRSSSFVSLR